MGGTYKSVRHTPHSLQTVMNQSVKPPGPLVPDATFDGTYAYRDSQETTSWRSRGRKGDILISPSTSAEFVTWLKEDQNEKRPGYDMGHEFTTKKITRTGGFQDGGVIRAWNGNFFNGREHTFSHPVTNTRYLHDGVWRNIGEDPDPSWFITTNDVASGKALLNSAAPNRPVASLSTALAELIREGLPSMIGVSLLKDRASSMRGLGSEYLNVQFGWIPFVSDVIKIVNALQNAQGILDDYVRNSGQIVRRRRSLPPLQRNLFFEGANISNGSAAFHQGYKPDGSSVGSSGGGFSASATGTVVSVSCRQDRWFSGAFTYYVPEAGHGVFQDLSRFEALANKLLGTRLNPETLWNLTPWSWLADWLFGIQNNISVASRFSEDGLVLRYGYLMVRDRVTVSSLYGVRVSTGYDTPQMTKSAFERITYDRKRRIRSTPFGFGLNPLTDFSARQWSILAALGMTKAPRTLR
jgi:hypothetical protein